MSMYSRMERPVRVRASEQARSRLLQITLHPQELTDQPRARRRLQRRTARPHVRRVRLHGLSQRPQLPQHRFELGSDQLRVLLNVLFKRAVVLPIPSFLV